jgi:hypothetical protein
MIIEITERCRCGSFLSLFEDNGRWVCSCMQRCYDPSVEDPTPIESLYGRGETPADAVVDYLRLREDADLEPVYVPTDLASFVVPKSPEGWGFSVGMRREPGDGGRVPAVNRSHAHNIADGWEGHPTSLPLPIYYGPIEGQKAANQ